MRNLLQKYISNAEKTGKITACTSQTISFDQQESRLQDLFTNMFPLDGKIKLSVSGVSENGKKCFSLARKSVFTSRNKVVFQKLYSSSRQRSPNKRIMFQVDRKSFSTSRKWRICLRTSFN